MVLPPFGFSVGDFIAVIGQVQKIGKALQDHNGASTEYQRLLQHLQALRLIFQHLEELESSEVNRTLINAVQTQAHLSLKPLNDFLNAISKYDKRLGTVPWGGRVLGSARKAQWAVVVAEEVSKLQSTMSAEVEKMNLLMGVGQLNALSRIERYLSQSATTPAIMGSARTSYTFRLSGCTIMDYSDTDSIGEDEVPEMSTVAQSHTSGAIGPLPAAPPATHDIQSILQSLGTQRAKQSDSIADLRNTVEGLAHITRALVIQNPSPTLRSTTFLGVSIGNLSKADFIWLKNQASTIYLIIATVLSRLLGNLLLIAPQLALLLRMTGDTIIRAPNRLLSTNILFEDCLGQIRSLDFAFFKHWDVFQSMIQSEFKNKPGASLVMQKLYQIVNSDGQLVTKDNWENIVLPGSTVAMSMIMRNLRVRGSQCPRPGCFGDGKAVARSLFLFQCPKCELKFTPTKGVNRPNNRRHMNSRYTPKVTDGVTERQLLGPVTREAATTSQKLNVRPDTDQAAPPASDSKTERRLRQARLQARKREQAEVAIFKRIHVPESTHAMSFRQVVLVYNLLSAWATRHEQFPTACCLTTEERLQLSSFAIRESTESCDYSKFTWIRSDPSGVVYRGIKKFDGATRRNRFVYSWPSTEFYPALS
ncbi:hypothetical protein IFR05_014760 [Cadophora sp. M221]|nr:hypothetical protein IFR05_014760 [Cadophora sp. M221]